MRQVIEKALPLPLPDTLAMPSQRATERTPEMGIEEDVVNTNGSKGVRSEGYPRKAGHFMMSVT